MSRFSRMRRMIASAVLAIGVGVALPLPSVVQAQELSGLARVDVADSHLQDSGRGLWLKLGLSQGVPYRVYTLADPARLVLDFREVDWGALKHDRFSSASNALAVRFGSFRPGWSRMVVALDGPLALKTVEMQVDQETAKAQLQVQLSPVSPEIFKARSGAPYDPRWDLPEPALVTPKDTSRPNAQDKLIVVLDPGHGGVDPGAQRDGLVEKELMLRFARELKDVLLRSGGFEVVLTRDRDEFISLERRVAIAHQVRAHVFLSLHADALSSGQAHGATVYLLAESASDKASALLAERHDRDQLLSGVDLNGQADEVATILMDLARQETQPRTERLAQSLISGIGAAGGALNKKPLRRASFSVLKAADIPSVLIEVGFMSSPRDVENLKDPNWRFQVATGIRDALQKWRIEDAALSGLVRQ